MIRRIIPWTQQPQIPVKNTDVVLFASNIAIDRGKPGPRAATDVEQPIVITTAQVGMVATVGASTALMRMPTAIQTDGAITLFALVQWQNIAPGSYRTILASQYDGNSEPFTLRFGEGNCLQGTTYRVSPAVYTYVLLPNTGIADGEWGLAYMMMGPVGAGSYMEVGFITRSGKRSSSTTGTSISRASAANYWTVGYTSASRSLNKQIGLAGVAKGFLTDEQLRNIWSTAFDPQARDITVGEVAAGGFIAAWASQRAKMIGMGVR